MTQWRPQDAGAHDFRVQLRDLNFRGRIEGQGPPLVLVHGGMLSIPRTRNIAR